MASNDDDLSNMDNLDLDFDSFDEDVVDDRNPALRIGANALSNFASMDNMAEVAGTILKGALPQEYSSAFDTVNNAYSVGKSVFDDTIQKLEPGINSARKLTNALLPKVEGILPKGITHQLREFSKDNRSQHGGDNLDPNDLAVIGALKDVFGAEQVADQLSEKKEEISKRLDRSIAKNEFVTNLTVQSDISKGISRLVGFQDGILNRYYRKSLELQYRHYFVARDAFIHQKATSADVKTLLDGIMKNTGLPNEVKVKKSEIFFNENTKRLAGSVTEGIRNRLSNIPGMFRKGIDRNIREFASNFNEAVGGASDAVQMGEDMEVNVEQELYDTTSNGIANFAGNTIGAKVGAYGKDKLASTAIGKILSTFGIKLGSGINNSSRGLNELMRKETEGGIDSWWKSVLGKTLVGLTGGPTYGLRESVKFNLKSDSREPVPWDYLSRQTLVQIIPGYLAKQLEQLIHIATNVKDNGVEYDVSKEKFISKKEIDEDVKKKLKENISGVYLKNKTDEIFKILDPEGTSALSDEDKREIAVKLINDSADARAFSFNKYTNTQESGHNGNLARLLTNNLDTTGIEDTDEGIERAKNVEKLSGLFDELTNGIGNFSKIYNETNVDSLRRVGVLNDKNETNQKIRDGIIRQYLGDTTIKPFTDTTEPSIDTSGRFMGGNSSTSDVDTTESSIDTSPILSDILQKIKDFRDIYKRKVNETNDTLKDILNNNTLHLDKFKEYRDIFKRKTNELIDAVKGLVTLTSPPVDHSEEVSNVASGLSLIALRILNMDTAVDARLDFVSLATETIGNNITDLNGKVNTTNDILNIINQTIKTESGSLLGHFTGSSSLDPAVEGFQNTSISLLERIAIGVENMGTVFGLPNLNGVKENVSNYFNTKIDNAKGLLNNGKEYFNDNLGLGNSFINRNIGRGRGLLNRNVRGMLGFKETLVNGLYSNTVGRITGGYTDDNLERVFIKDELESPVMTMEKLQRGFYYDGETNTKITKWSDIKGEVTTKNRARIILTLDQFNEGLVDENNKPIDSWIKRSKLRYGNTKDSVLSFWRMNKKEKLKSITSNVVGRVSGSYTDENLEEVYVKDEYETPVMTLDKLKRGNYYSGVTGKKIKKWSEIDGEVRTKLRKIIVSVEQFQKGLVDINGKPIKTLFNKAYNKIKSMYGILQNPLDKITGLASTIKSSILNPIDTFKKLTSGVGDKAWNLLSKPRGLITDLYLKGKDRFPILTVAKLRAGEYYDKITKLRLMSWSDIKNDIVDIHGNVVVSVKDFYKNLVDTRGKNILTGFSKILGYVKGLTTAPFKFIGDTYDKLTNKLPSDLYVAGEEEPRLYYRILKEGGYFNKFPRRKKVIKDWSEIKTNIVNSEGVVLLTKEDIKKGLVTRNGLLSKVTGFISNTITSIKDNLLNPLEFIKNITANPISAIGNAFKWVGGMFSGIMSSVFDFTTSNSKMVDVLKDIYGLLYTHTSNRGTNAGFKSKSKNLNFNYKQRKWKTLDEMGTGESSRTSAVVGRVSSKFKESKDNAINTKDRLKERIKDIDIKPPSISGIKDRIKGINVRLPNLNRVKDINVNLPNVEGVKDKFKESSILSDTKYIASGVIRENANKLKARFKRKKGSMPNDEFDAILDLKEESKENVKSIVRAIQQTDDTPELRHGSWMQQLRDRDKTKGKGKLAMLAGANSAVANNVTKPVVATGVSSIISLIAAIPVVVAAIPAILSGIAAAAVVVAPIIALGVGLGLMKSAYNDVHDRRMKKEADERKKAGIQAEEDKSNGVGEDKSSFNLSEKLIPGMGILNMGKRLYDNVKFSSKLQPLEMLRFLQYGIPADNAYSVTTVRFLEDYLYDDVKLNSKGKATLDFERDDVWNDCHAKFGLLEKSIVDRKNFETWFYLRFLPIFIKHKVIAKFMNVKDLLDIDDDLDSGKKFKFVSDTQFGPNDKQNGVDVYSVMTSPFRDIALTDNRVQIDLLAQQIRDASMRGTDTSAKNTSEIKNSKPRVAPPGAAAKAAMDKKTLVEKDISAREEARKAAGLAGPSLYDRAVDSVSRGMESGINSVKGLYNKAVDYTSNKIIPGIANGYNKAVNYTSNTIIPGISNGYNKLLSKVSGGASGSFDKKAAKYLPRLMHDLGLTEIEAAGIIGNLGHESAGMRAGIQEVGKSNGKGGLGWAQWTGVRRRRFEAFLASNGLSATDDEANYQYLLTELKGEESAGLTKIKGAASIKDAVFRFERGFERSGDVDESGRIVKADRYQSRYDYASRALNAYKNQGGEIEGGTQASYSSGSSSNSVSTNDCIQKYGNPISKKNIITWDIPGDLRIRPFPARLECNKDLVGPLSNAFKNIISRNLTGQLKSFDGCLCIRKKRGGSTWSLHSWGIAIDINASTNGFGARPTMSSELVKCFTDAGFDWGGNWSNPDGMHFQLSSLSGEGYSDTETHSVKSKQPVDLVKPPTVSGDSSKPTSLTDTSVNKQPVNSIMFNQNKDKASGIGNIISKANGSNSMITDISPIDKNSNAQIHNLLVDKNMTGYTGSTQQPDSTVQNIAKNNPDLFQNKPLNDVFSPYKKEDITTPNTDASGLYGIDVPKVTVPVNNTSALSTSIVSNRTSELKPPLDETKRIVSDNVIKDQSKQPIINVNNPDLSGINDASTKIGKIANDQRDEQLKTLLALNDNVLNLTKLIDTAIKNMAFKDRVSSKEVDSKSSWNRSFSDVMAQPQPEVIHAPINVNKK